MTAQPGPTPGEDRSAGQVLRPLRDIAALVAVAAPAVLLFVAVLRLIPSTVGEQFASRTQDSFYSFVNVPTIVLPLLAVLLATLIRPVHPRARLITMVALLEYAVAAVFGVVFGVFVGLVQIADFSVRVAFEELLVRVTWLAVFALAAYAVFQIWRHLYHVPGAPTPPGVYGHPQQYGPQGQPYGAPAYGQQYPPQQFGGQQFGPHPGAHQPGPHQPGPHQPYPATTFGSAHPQSGPGQPGPGQSGPGQPGPGQPAAGQPHPAPPAWNHAVSEQPGAERPAGDRAVATPAWSHATPPAGQASTPPGPFTPAPGHPTAPPFQGTYGPAPGYPTSGGPGDRAPGGYSEPTQVVPGTGPEEERTRHLHDGPSDEDPSRR